VENIGPLKSVFKTVRVRSGAEYKRSYSGPAGDPSNRGNTLAFDPILHVDATWHNGLQTSVSFNRRRVRDYSLAGAGSVTESVTGATSVTVNYRFSAPQGLKLPFFGQKLKFQSNLDCSLTFRASSKVARTAADEASLVATDPSASTREFSIVGDATYSFSRNVSGGLRMSFAQDRDEKRDRTQRTIGMHLTAEFKF
jgi:cell surface protein SprA